MSFLVLVLFDIKARLRDYWRVAHARRAGRLTSFGRKGHHDYLQATGQFENKHLN
jgi:hypothetical protein